MCLINECMLGVRVWCLGLKSFGFILTMFLATGARRDAVDTNILIILLFRSGARRIFKNWKTKIEKLCEFRKLSAQNTQNQILLSIGTWCL